MNGYIPTLLGIVSGWHQGASWTRCLVHLGRNVQGRVGAKHRAHMVEELRAIFAAPEATQARAMAHTCAARWRASHPAVAAQLEEELEPCVARYAVPSAPRVRTTNGLERLNQELKRRTRVVRIVPNRAALRLVTALAMEQSEEWVSGRRYLDMELLKEMPAPAATPVAEAV
jgi:putative transposase